MKDTIQLIEQLKKLMVANNYSVTNPVTPSVMVDLMRDPPPEDWDALKKGIWTDIQLLFSKQQDYAEMFSIMDGAEYNGLTLYNLVQAENGEPLWSNIYVRNVEARDSEIYVDPNLADTVLIGEDGMSLFAYSFTEDRFQIRDKASTEYVIDTHKNFSDFLSELIKTVN